VTVTPPPPERRKGMLTPVTDLLDRIRGAVGLLYREVLKFGVVGSIAFAIDIGLFNLLSTGLWPGSGPAPLDGHEKIAKIASATLATLVAWLGNRHWSFRHRRQAAAHRELLLFAIMNVGGMLIGVTCLTISHDVLGFTSPLADNVSGNLIGTALGTLFRFWAYRTFVFTELRDPAAHDLIAVAEADDAERAATEPGTDPGTDPAAAAAPVLPVRTPRDTRG
jgi:putative flippase GtrA